MIRALLLVALVATVAAQAPVTPKPANATAAATTAPAAAAKPAPAAAAKPAATATATPAATAKSAAVPAAAAGAAAAGTAAVATKDAAMPGAAAAEPAMPTSPCGAAMTSIPFTLKSISGSGCENNEALLGKPYACAASMVANVTDFSGPAAECTYNGEPYACAASMVANVTDFSGPAAQCTYNGEASMGSGEAACAEDGVLGNAKVAPAKEGVRELVQGTWVFAKPGTFEGKVNADGSLTIMTPLKDGTMCELTYTAGVAKKPVKLPADEADALVTQAKFDAEQVKEDTAAIANGTMPAPDAPKKSSAAAAAGVSGFMLLLGAAAALF
uniref:Uncharacterized protein n=1 Tax=Tetradesmus obliquus TaxID=3088 RepID=A0A383V4R9_TETOB|eukprot:jgi/Sobl393_1/6201/SZX59943.1